MFWKLLKATEIEQSSNFVMHHSINVIKKLKQFENMRELRIS